MQHSENINEIATALSKAQSKFENVFKSNKAKIRTKAGAEYSYSYAELADFLDITRQPLTENNLCLIQSSNIVAGELLITTMLVHSSGQWFKNTLPLPIVDTGNNALHAIGSSITYGRRYEAGSILGVASDEDDDANSVPKGNPKTSQSSPVNTVVHKVTPNGINVEDQKITKEQGEALLKIIAGTGYNMQDLKEMILFELDLKSVTEICNKHLPKIKTYFSKTKATETALEEADAHVNHT